MVGVLVHPSLLTLFIAAQVAAARAIPSSSAAYSQTDLGSSTSSSSPPPATFSTNVPVTHGVTQQQAQTGHNYAIDPFGVLGSPGDSVNGGSGGGGSDASQQVKQTSKGTETTTNAASTEASKTSSTSSVTSSTGASTTSSGASSGSMATSSSSVSSSHESSTSLASSAFATNINSALPNATPSQSNDSANGSSSSGSGMNSWKMIGIGILAFAGIVLLVLGTAFQDSIMRALRRPFKRHKGDGDEVLVPDWRRGSWRFGEGECEGAEKFDDGSRIIEGEKGSLGYPLPPVSPFPVRRTPSTNSRHPTDSGISRNGAESAAARCSTDNDRSILPSPPPAVYAPQLQHMIGSTDAGMNPFKSPHESTDADAYGGIE